MICLFWMRQIAATDSDLALLNSGTLRSDRIHPAGPFTLRDLNHILPMLDPLIVIEVTGQSVLSIIIGPQVSEDIELSCSSSGRALA